jgi:DNA-binding XRE family transcriptional regulator
MSPLEGYFERRLRLYRVPHCILGIPNPERSKTVLEGRTSRTNTSYLKVAQAISITKASMSQFENGVVTPSANTLIALADYFDVSIDYLVGRSDNPERR